MQGLLGGVYLAIDITTDYGTFMQISIYMRHTKVSSPNDR